jgi:hypothetical protein
MNVSKESIAKRLLEALAETNHALREGAIEIRRLRGVAKATSICEVFKYTTDSTLEAYLDAELRDGNEISWLLDVVWTDADWTIRRILVKSDSSGQETIKELPTKTIEGFDELVEILPRMTVELLSLRTPELDYQ